jgi:hypothetical protein
MYDELVKTLRLRAALWEKMYDEDIVLKQAADVIEGFSKTEKTAKPHGRLIDADALKEQLQYVASLEWNQRVGASPGIECAIDMLDDAQTVIPADDSKEK